MWTRTISGALLLCSASAFAADLGWTNWRGPQQSGWSPETGLVESWEPGGQGELWSVDLAGRGTPVIVAGDDGRHRLHVMGYRGEGRDLVEVLVTLDANSGELLWERPHRDFLSDVIYSRYSVGSPVVDPETDNVYAQTTNGVLFGVTRDGEPLWEISMLETYGRLTFPNGRTGAPIVVDDLVIVHGITANWGREGPGRDRFYAFDKLSGELVWSSTPGIGPVDSSYSTPLVEERDGLFVLYAGTGCGNVVAVNAANGAPLWRAPVSRGGVNVSLVRDGDRLIGIHAKDNLDTATIGGMFALDLTATPVASADGGAPVLQAVDWRNDLVAFTSSPVFANDTVYQTVATGELVAVNALDGVEEWRLKLAPDQVHASPLYADGKLYVPMHDGSFHIVKPGDNGPEILSSVQLAGVALGAPSVFNGVVYVHTTEKLYAIGVPRSEGAAIALAFSFPEAGKAMSLLVQPAELIVGSGESVPIAVRGADEFGYRGPVMKGPTWQTYIPPTAKVHAEMEATVSKNVLTANADAGFSAGAFMATVGRLNGTFRGRTVSSRGIAEDFEGFTLNADGFDYPPLSWIGARIKWRVVDLAGNQVLEKRLDRMLFQRSMTFFGHSDMADYTLSASVMTGGNRRMKGDVGLVHQRYVIALKGNQQQIEVSSNYERLREGVSFEIKENTWYNLETEVDVGDDGVGVIRVRAWPQGAERPDGWTLEVTHANAHQHGAPGLYGFSPQNMFPVYIDDVRLGEKEAP